MVEPIEAQTQLYGKSVSELQSDITINKDGTISGTLNYIKDYKQFSDVEEEQSGNYLALKFKEATEGKNVKVKLTKEVTLDEDGQLVLRVTEESKLKPLTVTVDSNESYTLSLSNLILKIKE